MLSTDELADKIVGFFSRSQPLLFAGAGIGARAGLPNWYEYLDHLVAVARRHEPATAELMRVRIEQVLLTEAASLYKRCPLIPAAELLEQLAAPFATERYDASKLHALISLPFTAIATTNFDRSLCDAYAFVKQKAPTMAELGDPTLKQAIYNWNKFYIARIHGRAEVPNSIVVATEDYARTENDDDYHTFLFRILTQNACLFLGFSFLDPAIDRILREIRERVGVVPRIHAAVLPADATKLATELSKYSIEVWSYDPAERHDSMWKAIRKALSTITASPTPVAVEPYPHPLHIAKHLLSCCYARLRLGDSVQSLRQIVAEGIILALVSESGHTTIKVLSGSLRAYIPLTDLESEGMVRGTVDALVEKGWLLERKGGFDLARKIENQLEQELQTLVESTVDRLLVREGHTATKAETKVLRDVIEDVVLLRGWDMGANFASARPPRSDLIGILRTVLQRRGGDLSPGVREKSASGMLRSVSSPERY